MPQRHPLLLRSVVFVVGGLGEAPRQPLALYLHDGSPPDKKLSTSYGYPKKVKEPS